MTAERWLPVIGFEAYYDVSDAGRVRSVNRWLPAAGERGPYLHLGRVLKQIPHPTGYLCVCLGVDGKKFQRRVHRLVCEAFHGPCPLGMEALHGPGGQRDNSAANLHWGTHSENLLDTRRDGTTAGFPAGAANPAAKLSDSIAHECRRRYQEGDTLLVLATEYGVDVSSMAYLIRGETWKDADYIHPSKRARAQSAKTGGENQ